VGAIVASGGDYDRWDLEVRGGLLGSGRVRLAVEEHGSGGQLVRLHWWPRYTWFGLSLALLFVALVVVAVVTGAPGTALAGLGAAAVLVVGRLLLEGAGACGAVSRTIGAVEER
jgi:hypothetical protein